MFCISGNRKKFNKEENLKQMIPNIVDEFKDERTHFTPPCNDDELSAGAALFVSDQLMKTKKGEIITNTKKKVQSKEI